MVFFFKYTVYKRGIVADIFAPPPRLQSNQKKKQKNFELQLLGCHTTLQARVCAYPFEAQGADQQRHMEEVGVVCKAGRGVTAPSGKTM